MPPFISRPVHLLRYLKKVVIRPFEREVLLVRRFVASNSVAIDVGANTGLYTEAIGRCCSTVFAFEPDGQCYSYLSRIRAKNWVIENIAAANATGNAVLRTPVTEGGLVRGLGSLLIDNSFAGLQFRDIDEQPVRSVRLDDYFSPELTCDRRISFVKIDVEGFEYEVLQGAREVINKHRPVFLIECEFRHSQSVSSVFDFFRIATYVPLRCDLEDPRTLVRLSEDQLRDAQDQHHGFLRSQSASYINNVLFVPAELENALPRLPPR